VLLRDHPGLSYHGLHSWPPVWTWIGGTENKRPQGEIGILRQVIESRIELADRCFLYIDHEGSSYMGCLLIEDSAFCREIVKLLQGRLNRPLAEIGNLDLSSTL
jgi:hypothetical protein